MKNISRFYYGFPPRKMIVNLFRKVCLSRKIINKSAVFSSNPDFSDNIFPLFIELQKLGYKCLWVLDHKYSRKVAKNYNVKTITCKKTVRSMFILSSYKYFFYSHHLPYMYKKRDQIIYDCWHGSPFKKYHGVQINNKEDGYYFVPSGKGSLDRYKKMYPDQIDIYKSIPFRHFRTDFFIKNFSVIEEGRVESHFNFHMYNRVFLCCLTWIRDSEKSKNFNNLLGMTLTDNDFIKLNDVLKKYNSLFIIKPHPAQKIINNMAFSNIVIASSCDLSKNMVQLYSLIAKCDALFTDYSSILFDYCLLDKPVGHIIHDWDYFVNNNNEQFIYDNPDELMYGTKIHTLDELIDFIINPKQNNNKLRARINVEYNNDPLLTESSTLKFIKEVLHEKI